MSELTDCKQNLGQTLIFLTLFLFILAALSNNDLPSAQEPSCPCIIVFLWAVVAKLKQKNLTL